MTRIASLYHPWCHATSICRGNHLLLLLIASLSDGAVICRLYAHQLNRDDGSIGGAWIGCLRNVFIIRLINASSQSQVKYCPKRRQCPGMSGWHTTIDPLIYIFVFWGNYFIRPILASTLCTIQEQVVGWPDLVVLLIIESFVLLIWRMKTPRMGILNFLLSMITGRPATTLAS